MSLNLGELFAGRYLVEREVGQGGMGTVYEAVDQTLDRVVAIKVLQSRLATPEFLARFEREASVLAKMRSPHILAIYDYGTADDVVHLVTPYLPDGDLAQWLKAYGPLPRPQALRVVSHVAEALADAHENGVVHRDVKPANVLLWRRRTRLLPFLCDFGIAKDDARDPLGLTRTNAVIGSTSYMAPERHRGEEASRAADVYALGCLLWATLTGHAPFQGTEYEVMTGHVEGAIPQLPATDEVAAGINEVLTVSMAKDPAERTMTAEQVAEHLGRLAGIDPTDATLFTGQAPPPSALDADAAADLVDQGVEASPTPTPTPPPAPDRQPPAGPTYLPTVVRHTGSTPVGPPSVAPPPSLPPPPPPPVPDPPIALPSGEPVGGSADGPGRRRGVLAIVAAVVAVAAVGTGVAVTVAAGDDDPSPVADGATSSSTDATGAETSTSGTPSPAVTADPAAVPGAPVPTVTSTYRSVTYRVGLPAGARPADVGTEVQTSRGGAWRAVRGGEAVVPVTQGGDRACASFRAVRLDGAAGPGPVVEKCGRAEPRSVALVEVDAPCDRAPGCRYFNISVAGFAPGSRPQAYLSYTDGGAPFCAVCTDENYHRVRVDDTGRGLLDGQHAGHSATAVAEWFIEPSSRELLLEVDGVRATYVIE